MLSFGMSRTVSKLPSNSTSTLWLAPAASLARTRCIAYQFGDKRSWAISTNALEANRKTGSASSVATNRSIRLQVSERPEHDLRGTAASGGTADVRGLPGRLFGEQLGHRRPMLVVGA